MKAYDLSIPLSISAVIRAESAEEAERLGRELADRFSDCSQSIDGSAYRVSACTEFSCNYHSAATVHVEEAYNMNDLAEAADGDICTACERDSFDCSRDPCAAVIADRSA